MKRYPTGLVTLAVALLTTLTTTSGARAADDCPNAAIRAQQHAEFLPDCRAYELVSPVEKNGTDVTGYLRLSDDGNAIAWFSIGAYASPVGFNVFGGYVARRGSDGRWTTSSMTPPDSATARPGINTRMGAFAFSPDLSSAFVVSNAGYDAADSDGHTDIYRLVTGSADPPTWVSKDVDGLPPNELVTATIVGASADGSTAFYTTPEGLSDEVTPGTSIVHLYRWRNGISELVDRDEQGTVLAGGATLGTGTTVTSPANGNVGVLNDSSAVSSDGSTFVYRDGVGPFLLNQQLYLHRADGTVDMISASQASGSLGQPAANGARFLEAVADFSIIYLASEDQLTDDAPVGGGDYRYDVGSGDLRFVVGDPALSYPQSPRGFIRASDDGKHVYFGSTESVVAGGIDEGDQLNFYVDGPAGVRRIGPANRDADVGLAAGDGTTAPFTRTALSDDGTRFVYVSHARDTAYDNDGFAQVYLYDALSGVVRCLSCNPRATKSIGQAGISAFSEFNAATPRVMSHDGRRVVFTSPESLVPQDTNGQVDVYEWTEGRLSLVSTGTSARDTNLFGMSADGSQIFLQTRSKLVASDSDGGLLDIYSARVDGGFADALPTPQCSDDACQGTPTRQTAPQSPGSGSFRGAEDHAEDSTGATSRKLSVTSSLSVAGSSGILKVTAPGKGVLRVTASGLRKASTNATGARVYGVRVALSARSARQLRSRHRVSVRATVRYVPTVGRTQVAHVSLIFTSKLEARPSGTRSRASATTTSDSRKGH